MQFAYVPEFTLLVTVACGLDTWCRQNPKNSFSALIRSKPKTFKSKALDNIRSLRHLIPWIFKKNRLIRLPRFLIISPTAFVAIYFTTLLRSPIEGVPNILEYNAAGWLALAALLLFSSIADGISFYQTNVFILLLRNRLKSSSSYLCNLLDCLIIAVCDILFSVLIGITMIACAASLIFFATSFYTAKTFADLHLRLADEPLKAEQMAGNVPIYHASFHPDYRIRQQAFSANVERDNEGGISTRSVSTSLTWNYAATEMSFYTLEKLDAAFFLWEQAASGDPRQHIENALEFKNNVICDFRMKHREANTYFVYSVAICPTDIPTSKVWIKGFGALLSQLSWTVFTVGEYYMTLNPFVSTQEGFAQPVIFSDNGSGDSRRDEEVNDASYFSSERLENSAAAFIDPHRSLTVTGPDALRDRLNYYRLSSANQPIGSMIVTGLLTSLTCMLVAYVAVTSSLSQILATGVERLARARLPAEEIPFLFATILAFIFITALVNL